MSKYPSHVGSELGKSLINSKEHKEIAKAIRKCLKGEIVSVKISAETKLRVEEIKNRK